MKKEVSRQGDSLIFEGITSISAVLKGGYRKIERILIDGERCSKKAREVNFLMKMKDIHGFDIEYTSKDEIDALTTGSSHGGIIAECTDRIIPSLSSLEVLEKGFYVMIDGIEDPYNFGYALRSIYAAGADAVILTPRNWMSAAGVVCRSSAGASELMPLYVSEGTDACKFFKEKNIKIAAAGIRDSVSAFDANLSLPIFLIVGGEKRGISSAVQSLSDITVRLDYGREFRNSLSAASAASILSYEILRQNRKK
ncbi:MAG: RNA methyltransferase [Clostridia bacterium]|nr:RNA methyltransferase [Clostridia bacterium]